MKAIIRFLFPTPPGEKGISLLLLVFRIFFGILLMTHGMQKLTNFTELSNSFPDPIGIGSNISLSLAIFGEVICSLGFIFGALYRLALIPMIINMSVAFFLFHAKDPFAVKELAFIYLIVFVIMFIAGPGKFAFDRYIARLVEKE